MDIRGGLLGTLFMSQREHELLLCGPNLSGYLHNHLFARDLGSLTCNDQLIVTMFLLLKLLSVIRHPL